MDNERTNHNIYDHLTPSFFKGKNDVGSAQWETSLLSNHSPFEKGYSLLELTITTIQLTLAFVICQDDKKRDLPLSFP